MPRFAVILPAAGSSLRFGANKLIENLGGKSVIRRSIDAFLDRNDVECVVVAHPRGENPVASDSSRILTCVGGPTRAESVLAALKLVPETVEWVAVHDAARPLVSHELINRTFAAAVEHGCAVPAMPVHLTIKQAPSPLPSDVVRTV